MLLQYPVFLIRRRETGIYFVLLSLEQCKNNVIFPHKYGIHVQLVSYYNFRHTKILKPPILF